MIMLLKKSGIGWSQDSKLFSKLEENGGTMNEKNIRSMGFTLVELLVVISIIALLLAVLMPALSKAREQAVRIICATNMKSTGTSMAMYIGDNKGTLPPDYVPARAEGKENDNDLTTVFWQQKLIPYTKNGKVFTCSNYEKYFSTKSSSAKVESQDELYNQVNKDTNWYYWYCSGTASSFGYNHRALGCAGWKSSEFGCYSRTGSLNSASGMRLPVLQVKAEQIKNSSGTILCLDNVSSFAIPPSMVVDSSNPLSNAKWIEKYHPKEFLHNKGVNMLYVDCHAIWKSLESPEFKIVATDQDNSAWGNCRQFPR
jgi:prepilin-type N-terminal cleavage/methylation domain-containing protein/prepilin-type processing-associated H-X9-DG protein